MNKAPKILNKKRLALLLLFFFLFSLSFAKIVHAFSSPSNSYQLQFEQAVFKTDEMNLQSFVHETMKAIGSSLFSFLGCFSCTPEEREKNPGFVSTMSNLMIVLYASPPASGTQYLSYLGEKIGISKPVYAQGQGMGFQITKPIRGVWTAFRNLSYILFVLIFIFIGFAIMFRVKISPQAVIGIQSALPRIIVALILVTFSYAIVGFMIDLMLVLTLLISQVFMAPGGILSTIPYVGNALVQISTQFSQFLGGGPFFANQIAFSVFFGLASIFALFPLILMGPISWIVGAIAIILIIIALIRCVWVLLKAYAMTILNLVFAPLQILVGALPGNRAAGDWFRNILANILVFPMMLAILLISSYLILYGLADTFADLPTVLLTIASGWLPGIGTAATSLVFALRPMTGLQFLARLILPLAGVMILLMAPKVYEMIQAFLTQKSFAYGTAIGETTATGKRIGFAGAEYGLSTAEARHAAQWAQRYPGAGSAPSLGWVKAIRILLGLIK